MLRAAPELGDLDRRLGLDGGVGLDTDGLPRRLLDVQEVGTVKLLTRRRSSELSGRALGRLCGCFRNGVAGVGELERADGVREGADHVAGPRVHEREPEVGVGVVGPGFLREGGSSARLGRGLPSSIMAAPRLFSVRWSLGSRAMARS